MPNGLSEIDLKIADYYAKFLFASVKIGESKICVWFPGAGKSTILKDCIFSKKILKKNLGDLYPSLVIVPLTLGVTNIVEEISISLNLDAISLPQLKTNLLKLVATGKEVLLVVDKLEDLERIDQIRYLKTLAAIINIYPRRIHSLINTFDYQLITTFLKTNPQAFPLANKIDFLPIITGQLVTNYIKIKAEQFNSKLNRIETEKIKQLTGGILFLTKEIIRSGNTDLLLAKIQTIWLRLNPLTRNALMKHYSSARLNLEENNALSILKKQGLLTITVFKKYLPQLNTDSKQLVIKNLSGSELAIFKYLSTKTSGALISKEDLAKALWGNTWEESYSDWALDATISRLRKKLVKCNLEPDILKTIKGKGYKWLLKI